MNMMDIIMKRKSVRTYLDKSINDDIKNQINDYIKEEKNLISNFGEKIELKFIDMPKFSKGNLIKNPQGYVIGKSKRTNLSLMSYGYVFENMILFLTGLGIGTCWLGAPKSVEAFTEFLELEEDEIIPAVTPIGYSREKEKFFDVFLKKLMKADKRKEWEELFFMEDFRTKISKKNAGEFKVPLEMVRIGPSAVNRQPWRIIISKNRKRCYFYLKNNSKDDLEYSGEFINIGIAMCHFENALKAKNIFGKWEIENPNIAMGKNIFRYAATFIII